MPNITEKQAMALRKEARSVIQKLNITREKDFQPHKLDWRNLNEAEAEIRKASTALLGKMDEPGNESTRAAEIGEAHDGLMSLMDSITKEKDYRAQIGDRGPRVDGASPFAPRPDDTECRGSEDGDFDFTAADRSPRPYILRHGQSMVEFLARNGYATDHAIRGVTEGGFLRAMVTGAKTDRERRALAEGSDSAGGYTVPTVLAARLIDRLRAKSVVFKAGAQTMPLTSDHHVIARVASDPAPAWRMENAAIAESEPTFDAIQLVPRSLAVMVKVSRELLEDSVNLETALPEIMAAAMAVELDRVALLGTGTAPQPRGIASPSGLTASGFAGGDLDYAALVKARTALRSVNHDMGAMILHARDEGTIAGLTDSTGQPLNIPPALANIPMLTTTAIPVDGGAGGDESMVLAGDFTKLLIGIRSAIRIEVSREVFAANHQYAFVAHLRADIAAEHNAAFTKLEGVTA